jgi:hypothetical protein
MYDAEYPHQCLGGWKSSDGLRLDPRVKFQPQRNYCSLGEKKHENSREMFCFSTWQRASPREPNFEKNLIAAWI